MKNNAYDKNKKQTKTEKQVLRLRTGDIIHAYYLDDKKPVTMMVTWANGQSEPVLSNLSSFTAGKKSHFTNSGTLNTDRWKKIGKLKDNFTKVKVIK